MPASPLAHSAEEAGPDVFLELWICSVTPWHKVFSDPTPLTRTQAPLRRAGLSRLSLLPSADIISRHCSCPRHHCILGVSVSHSAQAVPLGRHTCSSHHQLFPSQSSGGSANGKAFSHRSISSLSPSRPALLSQVFFSSPCLPFSEIILFHPLLPVAPTDPTEPPEHWAQGSCQQRSDL